jgi:hypothetical protein
MFGEWKRGRKVNEKPREDSIYASISSPSIPQNFLSKNAFKQLTSLSIMIYYVMDNLYFPSSASPFH